MAQTGPWRDHAALGELLASWRRFAGREIHHALAGAGWLRLALVGPERPQLVMTALPGAVLLWDDEGPAPPPVREALGPPVPHPAVAGLRGARLAGAGVLPADLVACIALRGPGGGPALFVLHQLFGSRGNSVILDEAGTLHWALHRPPHPLLTEPPPASAWRADPSPATPASPGAIAAAPAPSRAARDTANAALVRHLEEETARRLGRRLREAGRAAERLRDALERDLERAGRGADLRRAAEALAAGLHAVPRGAREVVLADPATGAEMVVPLDPAVTPAENLQRLFHRARKAERGRTVIASRLEDARRRCAEIARLDEELAGIVARGDDRLAALLDWRRGHADPLDGDAAAAAAGPREGREPPAPDRPFRRYLVAGRWEVWIGRSREENDELTHRAAAPDDIWLHAQGVAGSHVILRARGRPEQVPRAVLEKAAALAALHSKARHSALVPVMHTLRKHVRKPRKAPPGTAAPSRERTIFAEPGIPDGVEAI